MTHNRRSFLTLKGDIVHDLHPDVDDTRIPADENSISSENPVMSLCTALSRCTGWKYNPSKDIAFLVANKIESFEAFQNLSAFFPVTQSTFVFNKKNKWDQAENKTLEIKLGAKGENNAQSIIHVLNKEQSGVLSFAKSLEELKKDGDTWKRISKKHIYLPNKDFNPPTVVMRTIYEDPSHIDSKDWRILEFNERRINEVALKKYLEKNDFYPVAIVYADGDESHFFVPSKLIKQKLDQRTKHSSAIFIEPVKVVKTLFDKIENFLSQFGIVDIDFSIKQAKGITYCLVNNLDQNARDRAVSALQFKNLAQTKCPDKTFSLLIPLSDAYEVFFFSFTESKPRFCYPCFWSPSPEEIYERQAQEQGLSTELQVLSEQSTDKGDSKAVDSNSHRPPGS